MDELKYPGSCCDDCDFGREHDCIHAKGIHYDLWGEGIETPDWCWRNVDENGDPIVTDLPF